jgi:hypothetical protein
VNSSTGAGPGPDKLGSKDTVETMLVFEQITRVVTGEFINTVDALSEDGELLLLMLPLKYCPIFVWANTKNNARTRYAFKITIMIEQKYKNDSRL